MLSVCVLLSGTASPCARKPAPALRNARRTLSPEGERSGVFAEHHSLTKPPILATSYSPCPEWYKMAEHVTPDNGQMRLAAVY